MTLRHRITTIVLVSGIALGGIVAVPAAASAAQAPSPARTRTADPLAVKAQQAIDTFATFSIAGSQALYASFAEERDALAAEVAARLMIDPDRLQAAWSQADNMHQLALMAGLAQLGVPYHRNSSNPGVGFDCSGLTTYAWGQADVLLFRSSRAQINAAAERTRDTAQAGDLVYYPGHVMMYLGVDDAILHSPYTGRDVEVTYLPKHRRNSVRFGDPTG